MMDTAQHYQHFFRLSGRSSWTLFKTLLFLVFLPQWMSAQNFGTWTWMKGSNAAGALPVLGTQGVPDPANTPGPMVAPVGFKDLQGRFWVYGGSTIGGQQPFQMWMFDPSTNIWTWMSGPNILSAPAVYGTQGVSSPSNYPGSRQGACGWTDLAGNFWLFGNAFGSDILNDLWKYDISTNQWTWIKGTNISGDPGNYGTQGVPAMSNCPPARGHCSSWIDLNGDLWLFGGYGGGGNNIAFDDVWRYSVSTNMWTWMSGSAGLNNTPPNHGVLGVPAQSNTPGGRWTDSRWRDSNGNFWLFSGITGTFANPYADVWKFNPSTLLWTWMGGANTTFFTDSFTVKCSLNGGGPASADLNTVCWIDDCDRLWQFGGEGRNPFSVGYTNATWFFDPVSRKFKWQGGDLAYLQPGVYGAQGVSSPSNYPPSAMGGIGFNDNQGNFWMFGGCITPLFPGGAAETNTMWKFRPDSICNQLPSTTPIQTSISAFVPSACSPLQINFQSAISNSSFDYQWNFGDPNSTQDTASTVSTSYTFSSPGVYSVSLIVSGNSGCISGIDTAFFQLDLSNVNPLASSFSVSACSSYTAPWGAVYAQSGVYSDTLTAANGCDSIVTVNLTIKSPSQTNQNISSCGSFTAPDGTVYNQNSTFSSTFTGSNNCDSVVTYNLTILPPASVTVSPSDLNLSLGDTVQLFATGGSSYQWSPADGLSCTSCPSPLASPQTSVVYTVSTTNASGCTNSDSIRIKVDIKCNQLFIPDIFTPNATGPAVNEKLCAYSNCIRLFSFIIYNRWGERVFETTDIAACWDGTYKGKESPSGIYAFKLYAEQIDGTIVDKKGTITLVR